MAAASGIGTLLPLVDVDTEIPGVSDNSALAKWYLNQNPNGIFGASIRKSTMGGIGLFGVGSDLMIVLKMQTYYDYETLMQTMNRMVESNRTIVKTVLRALAPTTEISILQSYIVGFKICQQIGDSDDEGLIQILPYIEILCNTNVEELVSMGRKVIMKGDRFLEMMQQRYLQEQEDFHRLIESINPLKDNGKEMIDIDTFRQLNAAVRSRVMEIPHLEKREVEEEKGQEGNSEITTDDDDPKNYHNEDDKGDSVEKPANDAESQATKMATSTTDFVTNVTLVPYVDFANHSNKEDANAFFDYDTEGNSVVLKLDRDLLEETEITICYAPVEHVQMMIAEFGFVPRLTGHAIQILEDVIPLEYIQRYLSKFHGVETEYLMMCKWIGVFPRIKICMQQEEVYLVEIPYELLVLFSKDVRYNPKWRGLVINACSGMSEEQQREVIEDIEQQLENCDYIEANIEGVEIKVDDMEYNDKDSGNKDDKKDTKNDRGEDSFNCNEKNEYVQCTGDQLQRLFQSQLVELEGHLIEMIRKYMLYYETEAVQFGLNRLQFSNANAAESLTEQYLLMKQGAFRRLAERLEENIEAALTPPSGYTEEHEQLRLLWPKTSLV